MHLTVVDPLCADCTLQLEALENDMRILHMATWKRYAHLAHGILNVDMRILHMTSFSSLEALHNFCWTDLCTLHFTHLSSIFFVWTCGSWVGSWLVLSCNDTCSLMIMYPPSLPLGLLEDGSWYLWALRPSYDGITGTDIGMINLTQWLLIWLGRFLPNILVSCLSVSCDVFAWLDSSHLIWCFTSLSPTCSFDSSCARPTCISGLGFTRCNFCMYCRFVLGRSRFPLRLAFACWIGFTIHMFILFCLDYHMFVSWLPLSILDPCLWIFLWSMHVSNFALDIAILENARISIYNKLLTFTFSSHALRVHGVFGGKSLLIFTIFPCTLLTFDRWLGLWWLIGLLIFTDYLMFFFMSRTHLVWTTGNFTLLGVWSCDSWFLALMCFSCSTLFFVVVLFLCMICFTFFAWSTHCVDWSLDLFLGLFLTLSLHVSHVCTWGMWWLRGSVGIWGIYPIVPTIPFPLFTYRPVVWYELMWFVYIELCCFPWGNHPGRDDPPPRSVNRMAAIAAIGSRLLSPSLESKREWRFLRSNPPSTTSSRLCGAPPPL